MIATVGGLSLLPAFTVSFAQSTDETSPVTQVGNLAGPVGFNLHVVGDNQVTLSWNEQLPSDDLVDSFRVYDGDWPMGFDMNSNNYTIDIDRNRNCDFSVSALTASQGETRRSSRIYLDMPPADRAWDGGNRHLPNLTGVRARLTSTQSAEITWDTPPGFWRPSESTPYSYTVWIDRLQQQVTNESRTTINDLPANTITWVGIRASTIDGYNGRMMTFVPIDTRREIGTISLGFPGVLPIGGVRAEAYSHNSAELFWDGYPGFHKYQVYLNGRLLGRTTGTSYFISDLSIGERVELALGWGWSNVDIGHDSLLTVMDVDLTDWPGGGAGGSGNGGVNVPTVSNGLILLPANGWYQVQDSSTFQTVCEGVSSCSVAEGTYISLSITVRVSDLKVSLSVARAVEPVAKVARAASLSMVIRCPGRTMAGTRCNEPMTSPQFVRVVAAVR